MVKRILFFSLTYFPFIGGAEVAIKEVTDRISSDDYHFDMITLRFDSNLPKFERVGNVDIFRIGFGYRGAKIEDFKKFPLVLNKYFYPFMALVAAVVLHRRKSYQAVMTVITGYASFGALFFKFLFPKVSYIARADDGDPFDSYKRKTKIVAPLFIKLFTKADFLVTTSTYLLNEVTKMGYRGESVIVPNGVDAKHFSQEVSAKELEIVKKNIGKKEGDIFLVTTSRLVPKNGIDDCVQAMKLLPKNIYFLVYGIGPDEEKLKTLARQDGVEERVRFLGQLSHTDMPKTLKACDIFVRPSLSEGFGISFIEAMVAELPVVATQEGGIADFLYDPELNKNHPPTGRAVKVRDPAGIARAVELFIDNPEETKQIVANAKKMAMERYDWGLIAKQMKEKVLDELFTNAYGK